MLRHLLIENYGLISRAEIDFAEGATIFTGETGSGKTMLLGALGMVLGERASADAVRRDTPRAVVTLVVEPDDGLRRRFESDGFPLDSGEDAVITRDVSDAGKSSVRVNGRPATAGYVRELGSSVADMVGQHEAQRLLSPAYHVELLDRFGGEPSLAARAKVREAHGVGTAVAAGLAALEGDDRRARERYDDARHALAEIDAAAIEVGEDERLTQRRRFLDNIERVTSALRGAHAALFDDERGAVSAFGVAAAQLSGIADVSDELRSMGTSVEALQSEANELATELARRLDETEFDPAELETINARLDALDRLKRKHGGSLEEVVGQAAMMRTIVEDFDGRDERLVELRARFVTASEALADAARMLTDARRKAASALTKSVAAELRDLALASARFEVRFEPLPEIGPDGAEHVEFAFSANAGEPLRPLARVASGGELSRVLLALVVSLAERRERTALVFDEIDTGVGGTTATAVAARLGRLAADGQVVCVTHLAQIAAWADRHYVLDKSERGATTTISVREIGGNAERETELARMLSGETHDVALKHARTLRKAARALSS
jgi:DNA repair protein RecN (Recombination protein N)